jgi:hypothetical protein
MWYWIGIPVGLYILLRGVSNVYAHQNQRRRDVLLALRVKKSRAEAGEPIAVKSWKQTQLEMRELVLRSRRGDASATEVVDILLANGLIDENTLRP